MAEFLYITGLLLAAQHVWTIEQGKTHTAARRAALAVFVLCWPASVVAVTIMALYMQWMGRE